MNRRTLIKSLLALPAVPLASNLGAVEPAAETFSLFTSTDIAPSKDYSAMAVWEINPGGTFKFHGRFKVQEIPHHGLRLVMQSGNRFGKSEMTQEWIKSLTEIPE